MNIRNWNSTSWTYVGSYFLAAAAGASLAPIGAGQVQLGAVMVAAVLAMIAMLCIYVIAPAIRRSDDKRMNVAGNTARHNEKWDAMLRSPFNISVLVGGAPGTEPRVVYLGDLPRGDVARVFMQDLSTGLYDERFAGVTWTFGTDVAGGIRTDLDPAGDD